jgi:hypothetical protein
LAKKRIEFLNYPDSYRDAKPITVNPSSPPPTQKPKEFYFQSASLKKRLEKLRKGKRGEECLSDECPLGECFANVCDVDSELREVKKR